MEIERKFLVDALPANIEVYPFRLIEQGYLCTEPVIRVRRENEDYYMTYKGSGLMIREEYNLPLTKEAYDHLIAKADGNIIAKKRYRIPLESGLLIELDIFGEPFSPLFLAEVEFSSEDEAENFVPPSWFGKEVTFSGEYHNSCLSRKKF